MTTAVAAQELCRLQSNPAVSEEVAFTAGLLHDIGKIVLNQALGSDSEKLRESLADEGVSIVAAERALHGGDHARSVAIFFEAGIFPLRSAKQLRITMIRPQTRETFRISFTLPITVLTPMEPLTDTNLSGLR